MTVDSRAPASRTSFQPFTVFAALLLAAGLAGCQPSGDESAVEDAPPVVEVMEAALGHMEKPHPRIREFQESGVVTAWSRDPYALGAFSAPDPGDVTIHLEALQHPHGRIHFAGEHTTILRASMEGALRSGIRAAREVEEAVAG